MDNPKNYGFAMPVSGLGVPRVGDLSVAVSPSAGQGLALDPVGQVPLPALGTGQPTTGKFLRGDGSWATVTIPTFITGSINAAGTILTGTGYTAGIAGGLATITFTVAFAATPTVVVSAQNNVGADYAAVKQSSVATTGFQAFINGASGITFIAMTTV